jgi:bacterioferritin-associated ferredoxin
MRLRLPGKPEPKPKPKPKALGSKFLIVCFWQALNLAFCGRAMSDRMLEAVCKASENLHTLQLGGCYLLTDRGIAAAVKALPRLRILELSSCTKLSENSLDSIVCVGDTLESLALRRCPQLKAEALARIGELRHLRRLSLEGSQGVTDDTVRRIVAGCGASLEELDLSHLPDSGFTAVPATCGVTDEALRVLAKGCSRLRRLSLRNVDTITDEGLTVLASGCRFLADIDLARCKAVSDDGVEALAAGCKGLERLSLNAAGRTDVDEETGAASHSITDRTLRALGGCPRLSRLDLSWCRGMSDEFLGELVDSADALDALVLRGCAQITDIFLGAPPCPLSPRTRKKGPGAARCMGGHGIVRRVGVGRGAQQREGGGHWHRPEAAVNSRIAHTVMDDELKRAEACAAEVVVRARAWLDCRVRLDGSHCTECYRTTRSSVFACLWLHACQPPQASPLYVYQTSLCFDTPTAIARSASSTCEFS